MYPDREEKDVNIMNEAGKLKIDRVELTMGGNVFDAHIAEFWEPYTYGQEIPTGGQEIVPFEVVKEIIKLEGEFFRQEYYVRAWCGNMPFISRYINPICEEDLLGYGLLTTDMERKTNFVVRKIFGKTVYFENSETFHDFSPQKRISEERFFQNALTTVRIERDRLMPLPRKPGREAMWQLEEIRNRYIELRSALYWIGYDLEGFDEHEIEKYYQDMKNQAEALRDGPELKKRKWFQNNLKEIQYLFEEHYQKLMDTPENGYIKNLGASSIVNLPPDIRKLSDEIVGMLNDMRLNLFTGKRWDPDIFG